MSEPRCRCGGEVAPVSCGGDQNHHHWHCRLCGSEFVTYGGNRDQENRPPAADRR